MAVGLIDYGGGGQTTDGGYSGHGGAILWTLLYFLRVQLPIFDKMLLEVIVWINITHM